MRVSELNFPYPVLGMNGSIVGDEPVVKAIPHIPLKERIAEPYSWEFDVTIKNRDILDLIAAGKAQYMCEVMCSATLMRECFFSDKPLIKVSLDRKRVNKRVEFALFVVATERIPNYCNADANPDYKEIGSFDIAKGAPLAVLNSYHWDADLCYEDLTSLRSILQIVENVNNPGDEYAHLDTDGAYIKLELPRAQYKALTDAAGEPSVSGALHSSIILFALQGALMAYTSQKNHRWERALEAMISRSDAFGDLSLDDKEDVPAIALRLLGNPFKRFCESLPTLVAQGRAAVEAAVEDDED